MNRHDEIHAAARDVASNIHIDPAKRDAMADDLIKLIGLMIQGVGKYVASRGESSMNDWEPGDDEFAEAGTIYTAGERIQDAARELADDCQGADLDRYHRPTGTEWCRCGHHPDSHTSAGCKGELANGHPCYKGERPCGGFDVEVRKPVWVHEDRRPDTMRQLAEPGTVILPLVAPTGCGRCSVTQRCDDPVAGCYVHPPQCDVVSVNGTRCVKDYGHWTPRNSNVHEFHLPLQRGALPAATDEAPVWATYRPAATDEATCCHDGPLCPYDGQSPRAQGCCYPLGGACPKHQEATCCHGSGPCPWSRVKAGGCCYPKNAICPEHH